MLKSANNKVKTANKFSKISMSLVIVLVAGLGTYLLVNTFAATPSGTANIWINTTPGSCTYSSTPIGFNSATACGTMQDAVAASSNTTTTQIRMAAGSYSGQTITTNKTQATQVTITAEPGTNLTGSLTTEGDWVTLENINAKGGGFEDIGNGHPVNVTWRNVDISGGGCFFGWRNELYLERRCPA